MKHFVRLARQPVDRVEHPGVRLGPGVGGHGDERCIDRREGADHRFDALKPDFARFLLTWTLQGLWVFLTVSCALAAITAAAAKTLALSGAPVARADTAAMPAWSA